MTVGTSSPEEPLSKIRVTEYRKVAVDEVKAAREAITNLVRLLSVGYLFIYYLAVTDGDVFKSLAAHPYLVTIVGVSGLIGVVFDYVNSWARLKDAMKTYNKGEGYDKNSMTYRLAVFMFEGKQLICLAGGVALAISFMLIGVDKFF